MSAREAFRKFIRFQLDCAVESGKIDLSSEDIEKFASGVEDDPNFYEGLDDFLAEYIEDFGENYDLDVFKGL